MLAIAYELPGGSDVLRLDDIVRPDPGDGEVRVRLAVSGVNPTDWKSRAGLTGGVAGAFQIPGQDGAGVIDAVGAGVDPGRVGERVWIYFAAWQRPWGTSAQWTIVPSAQAVPLPDSASYELGASLGIPAMTAYACLFADGPIDGRTVLVAGGAGAVGHAAIALARWGGARVVATVSGPEKAAIASAAGAHATVVYTDADVDEQLRAVAPDGVDRIVEVALGANLELDLQIAAPNAVIVTYSDGGTGEPTVPVRRLMVANIALRFLLVYTMGASAVAAASQGVASALRDDALTTLPLHRFPLADAAAAHDAVERGVVGKVLVDIP